MRKHYPLNLQGVEDAGQLPWTDGVPSTGVQGSYPGHALCTDVEAEILAAIDAAGLARSGTDLAQLVQAMARGVYLGGFTGSANALSAALPNNVVFPALLRGMRFTGSTAVANTGPVTVTLTGFAQAPGTVQLLRRDGQALQAGDLPVGPDFDIRFDGANCRLIGPAPSEIVTLVSTSTTILTTINQTVAQSAAGKTLFSTTAPGAGSWTVPAGVYWIYVICVGAGAGGSGCQTSGTQSGAGGGAGGTAVGWVAVSPGQVINYVVGAGSAGVAYQQISADGGTSSVGSTTQATGGKGTSNSGLAGGAGGVGLYGQANFYGGAGVDGNSVNPRNPAGPGGASSQGGGGRSATQYQSDVSDGRAPGSGGGGVYNDTLTSHGGNGAAGYVSFSA